MVGRPIVVNTEGLSLREACARATLRDALHQGHVYIELRQVGNRPIFFCVLCQAQCFNDTVLSDHLNGNLHARRLAAAKITLFGPVPWPFSDGVLFFNVNGDEVLERLRLGDSNSRAASNGSEVNSCVAANGSKDKKAASKAVKSSNGRGHRIVIPGVLRNEEASNMRARFVGYGHIGARVLEADGGARHMSRIWCAWLGRGESDDCKELLLLPKCDFGIVCFPYTDSLGKRCLDEFDDAHFFEIDDLGHRRKKRKKSFSDPESSCDARTENSSSCSADGSDRLQRSKFISSKSVRRELRKQRHLSAGRRCDICCQPMLLGKDVATLLNCRTGQFACSSRNKTGAFHLFHTSCLIHWILFCESEAWAVQPAKAARRGRKSKSAQNDCYSIFCPECQGTGVHIEGDELEKLRAVPLSEMFRRKLKVCEAQKAWMKNPETLEKCSTGLQFPSDSSEKTYVQENVTPLKLLYLYRADE